MSEALSVLERSEWTACRTVVKRGAGVFYAVGQALLNIRDKRLYREEFSSFEEYCRQELGWGRHYANKLIQASEVAANIANGDHGHHLLTTERQARELVNLEPEQQRQVWQAAVETAPEGKITASHIRSVVDRMTQGEQSTIKAISREITARNAEAQNGSRETYRAEAMEAGLTPQEEVAGDYEVGWWKATHKIWVFLNSFRDHGGIAKLSRRWSEKFKREYLRQLDTIIDELKKCRDSLEKEISR